MADKAKDDKKDAELAAQKEGGAEGDAQTEGEGKSGKKKLIIILAGVLVLLGAAGAGLYFSGMLDKFIGHKPDCSKVNEGDPDAAACAEEIKARAANALGTFIEVPDMIVNLASGSGKQPHFLKITLKVELEKPEDEKPFTDVMPRVIDQFQTYLRELRLEDLRGSSGLYRMKIELLTRVKAAAPAVKVRDVLFQEILVQ